MGERAEALVEQRLRAHLRAVEEAMSGRADGYAVEDLLSDIESLSKLRLRSKLREWLEASFLEIEPRAPLATVRDVLVLALQDLQNENWRDD